MVQWNEQNMKFSQFFIALALGLVIFTGIYMSESERKGRFLDIPDPFAQTESLPDILILDASSSSQNILNKKRELWQFFPGSHTNFSDEKRSLVDGHVFVSFNFILESDAKTARDMTFESFDADTFAPSTAQFTIGSIGVSAPGASLFAERSQTEKYTEITAYDHAIDLWFPGANKPFVLPARKRVKIKDAIVDRLSKLYYTKLKKDLSFRSFDLEKNAYSAEGLVNRNQKLEDVKNFAKHIPNTWYWINPDSFMGRTASLIKFLQKDYALGIPQTLRMKFEFDALVSPFLAAHHHYLNNRQHKAEEKIDTFKTSADSFAWQSFIINNPQYAQRWEFLGQNQRIWLHHSFQDDPEYVFADIWLSQYEANSLEDLELAVFEIEEMMANGFLPKVKQGMVNLEKNIDQIDVPTDKKIRLSRVRRLINELIKENIALKNDESFSLLTKIIEKEVTLYAENNKDREEIILENAQDILWFLKDTIQDKTAGQTNKTLVNSYAFLEIDHIETQLGRPIFNDSEKKTIQLVQFARSENLTDAERAQLEVDQALRDSIDERREAIEQEKQQEQEAIFQAEKVDTPEELTTLLADARVFTEGIRIEEKQSSSNPTFVFSGAYYGEEPLSGTFRIDNQSFNLINLGDYRETYVDPRILNSILRRLADEIEEDRIAKALETKYEGPSNNTPLAILQRKLVQDTFDQEGLRVNRDKVTITSNDFNQFEVTDALMGKEYRIDFLYFQKEEYVTNLVVEYVRNRFEFGDQVIPRKGLSEFIEKAIEERFGSDD